jgi:hypothetical protein
MKSPFALIFTWMILSGCSSTIQVRIDEPLNNDRIFKYDQVNARSEYCPGTLVCAGGISYEVKGVLVARDSTRFFEMNSDIKRSIATEDVLSIRRNDRASGAFTGGLLGAVTGLTARVGVLLVRGRGSSEGGPGVLVVLLGLIGGGCDAGYHHKGHGREHAGAPVSVSAISSTANSGYNEIQRVFLSGH